MALWSERILIALPEMHRLAAKDILNWADLKRERFVLSTRDPGPEIKDILTAKLVAPGESLDINHHDVNAESLKSLVSARSEEHTSELQSLMRISYAVFCLQ